MGILCFALFWIHGNFMFWMTRVSVCNPSYWNSIAGFVIHTTGTLKLEDGLKTTNWLRRRSARKNKKKLWKLNYINGLPERGLSRFSSQKTFCIMYYVLCIMFPSQEAWKQCPVHWICFSPSPPPSPWIMNLIQVKRTLLGP